MQRTDAARVLLWLAACAGWVWAQPLPPAAPGPPSELSARDQIASLRKAPTAAAGAAASMPGARPANAAPAKAAPEVPPLTPIQPQPPLTTPLWPIRVLRSPAIFDFAQAALLNAAVFDMTLTAGGLRHPPVLHLTVSDHGQLHQLDIDQRARFAEGGWARIFGPHNTPAVVAAYAGEDLAMLLVLRHFAHHHPRWRALASLALLTQTWVHVAAGCTWIGLGQRLQAPYLAFNPIWTR